MQQPPGQQPIGSLGEHLLVYEILRGGMGEVLLCGERDSDTPQFALKTFQRRFFFDRAVRDAFVREVVLWSRLTGLPHIMPALSLETFEGRPFVVMPVVPPGPLGGRTVRDLLTDGTALPAAAVLPLAFQTAVGMHLAQRKIPGLVHGDLKPENLLVLGRWLLVSDLGLSRVTGRHGPSDLESTWAYRAPECWDADAEPSVAADVYAFGTVLFELLTGHTPYTVAGKREWEAAHRSGTLPSAPPPSDGPADDRLGGALMSLARDCLAPRPQQRPRDFGVVVERVRTAADTHEPMSSLMLMHESAALAAVLAEQQAQLDEQRIVSLFGMGEPQLGLEEIDSLPPERVTATLRYRRGTALSLLGQDDEALFSFGQALDMGLPTRTGWACQVEVALSYKRLGDLERAEQLLKVLAVEAPPDMRVAVLSNLATVHLAADRPQAALDLLTRVTAEYSDAWQAWGNQGRALEELGEWARAVDAYQHGLEVAPQETILQFRLAVVCMDHLRDIHTAWQALEMAHAQGLSTPEWYVRFLACQLLMKRTDEALALDAAARDELGEADATTLWNTAVDLARGIAEPGRDSTGAGLPDPAPAPAVASGAASATPPARPASAGACDAVPRQTPDPAGAAPRGEAPLSPATPFLNARMNMHTQLYTVDFYLAGDAEPGHYAAAFTDNLRRFSVRMGVEYPRGELRDTPFYFTRCPGCGGAVLTNRDAGKDLRCRWCDTTAPAREVRDGTLDRLRDAAERAAGLDRVDLSGHVLSLLVDTKDRERARRVRSIATAAGWELVADDHPLSSFLRAEVDRRGMGAAGSPTALVLRRTAPPRSHAYADRTPPDVERLLVTLRGELGQIVSLSHVHDPAADDPIARFLHGDREYTVGFWQRLTDEQPLDPLRHRGLAEALMSAERLDEALVPARRAVGLLPTEAACWAVLGRVHLRKRETTEAAEAFEKSLALDPVQPLVLLMLADCYRALDRPQDATEAASRAAALGRS
ncbi:protein kinase family protein [Streptomyces echinatus]|uniref:Tetratricopeptide (TPR) repeat protein n=1 Tax=Streptomyces echinatus TaxID=67293 RepID=A0A7W9PRP8_9ACTN|nr:protein kinase family protein [Streptomyces echinatus]MBB5926738.1 tetratricopeptide (TPR) repeat protein [Streptomyces echinatus]